MLLGGKEKLDAKIAKAREGQHTGEKQPAMATFEATRPSVAAHAIGIGAWAVGIGRAALEASRRYAKDRVQFGKPIAEFQAIQMMLADMATELDAARLLVWRAAWMQDKKLRTTLESSEAKYFAARASMRACNNAIQIHGGYGYTREFDVERYLRDAKLAEIGEGTNEVQKMVIAREILKTAQGGGG